jgi:hypothetical protein
MATKDAWAQGAPNLPKLVVCSLVMKQLSIAIATGLL